MDVAVVDVGVIASLSGAIFFVVALDFLSLSSAQMGYLHFVRPLCFTSLCSSCVDTKVMALCVRVLHTLYLADRLDGCPNEGTSLCG